MYSDVISEDNSDVVCVAWFESWPWDGILVIFEVSSCLLELNTTGIEGIAGEGSNFFKVEIREKSDV